MCKTTLETFFLSILILLLNHRVYEDKSGNSFFLIRNISIFPYNCSEAHSETSSTSKMEPFAKVVNGFQQLTSILAFNYFWKKSHLRCLIWFWIHLCLFITFSGKTGNYNSLLTTSLRERQLNYLIKSGC